MGGQLVMEAKMGAPSRTQDVTHRSGMASEAASNCARLTDVEKPAAPGHSESVDARSAARSADSDEPFAKEVRKGVPARPSVTLPERPERIQSGPVLVSAPDPRGIEVVVHEPTLNFEAGRDRRLPARRVPGLSTVRVPLADS